MPMRVSLIPINSAAYFSISYIPLSALEASYLLFTPNSSDLFISIYLYSSNLFKKLLFISTYYLLYSLINFSDS